MNLEIKPSALAPDDDLLRRRAAQRFLPARLDVKYGGLRASRRFTSTRLRAV